MGNMAERLQAARHRRFVGREKELALFRSALVTDNGEPLPFCVLYIYGPGGVGKTSLLREFARLAEAQQIPVYSLDGYNMEATPSSFMAALDIETKRLGDWEIGRLSAGERGEELSIVNCQLSIVNYDGRQVLLIDRYEAIMGLDRWLRREFLPQLPDNVLVMFAGRQSPTAAWESDPGWRSLLRALPLRYFSPAESVAYLAQEDVPAEQHAAIVRFTHGHPLALSLVADIFAQRPNLRGDYHFEPAQATEVIHKLVERFVEDVPSAAHRAALEACALARQMGEPLLAAMLHPEPQAAPTAEARELFNWLRGLSFIEQGPRGLWPHPLARESLAADLRWRNPDWYGELHGRARRYYAERLPQMHGQAQQEVLIDYIFLHRDNPVVRPFFHQLQAQQSNAGSVAADQMGNNGYGADRDKLLAMVERHEGEAGAQIAAHWFDRQPQGVTVYRDDDGEPLGFLMQLALETAGADDLAADPATAAAWRYLEQQAPLRPGEKVSYFRFWMEGENYQTIGPVQSLIFVQIVRHYLTTPGLAFSFLPCAAPDAWGMIFAYADLSPIPEADFVVGGRSYGVFGHDWRAVPPLVWLDLMAQRETAADPQSVARPQMIEPLVVLSQEEFAAAVHDALRSFTRLDLLDDSPLLRSRIILGEGHSSGEKNGRVERLQVVLREAADALKEDSRSLKYYRALYHAYLQPAPTQEEAAELLDVPYGSFRRHLKRGVAEVTDILWQQEVEG